MNEPQPTMNQNTKNPIDDGGPAFPLSVPFTYDPPKKLNIGMTLRAYGAGLAMQALLPRMSDINVSKAVVELAKKHNIEVEDYNAQLAVKQADAMIAARKEKA